MPFDSLPQEPVSDVDRVLKRAQELIETGWCQGTSCVRRGDTMFYCIAGALADATNEFNGEPSFRLWNEASVRLGFWPGAAQMVPWNDSKSRTKEQVIERLREARERAHAV